MLFYRRKPKPPSSTVFTPLLKLFKTENAPKAEHDTRPSRGFVSETQAPFLLSGPKSRFGLGIALHFIVIPDHPAIDSESVWKQARGEIRTALVRDGLPEAEADVFAWRLIDPLNPPVEVTVEYDPADRIALTDFRCVMTYQLLRGRAYDGTLDSLKRIYSELADSTVSLQAGQEPSSPEAAGMLRGITIRNVPITIRQEDIEKRTILDLQGKLREASTYFAMFTKSKYLKRLTPQDPSVIQTLYR
jgi:hypothetical protein